jgi:hypothetical protein
MTIALEGGKSAMHIHTGDHAERLTTPQRALLAAVLLTIVAVPVTLLIFALNAYGPAPAVPEPVPVTVQPVPVSVTHGPPLSV